MPEQIIDLQEGVMPGPRGDQGPRGEQGLPGVNAVPADSAVAGYITSDSQTASALADRYAPRDKRDMMVVFGDSMTVCGSSVENQWWHIVAARLGLRVRNYGSGGAGFVNVNGAGIDYGVELTNAINDTGVDRAKVRYVFVDASTNDTNRASAAAAAAAAWSERCRAAYPNAQCIAFGGLSGRNVRHTANQDRLMNYMRQFCLVSQVLAADGWQVFTNSPYWLVYNRQLTSDDSLHPNDAGLAVIAEYVLSGLQTGVYTSLSHSMGAVTPISISPLADGDDKSAWMAQLIEGGFCGGDHANAIWPLSNLSADYAAWQALPDINSISFYFRHLGTKLTRAQVQQYATSSYTVPKSISGATEDKTIRVGLDMPLCPLPYPFGMINAHGEAISRWSDGLDVLINGVSGTINAYLYQRDSSPALSTPADARYWLWLHFDYLPHRRYHFWAASARNGATVSGITGALGLYDLEEGLTTDTSRLTVTASGRIIMPIAGMWRP